jgi:hypothetical protein
VHTGEVEFTENDVRGIAVHIASRVACSSPVRSRIWSPAPVSSSRIRYPYP